MLHIGPSLNAHSTNRDHSTKAKALVPLPRHHKHVKATDISVKAIPKGPTGADHKTLRTLDRRSPLLRRIFLVRISVSLGSTGGLLAYRCHLRGFVHGRGFDGSICEGRFLFTCLFRILLICLFIIIFFILLDFLCKSCMVRKKSSFSICVCFI